MTAISSERELARIAAAIAGRQNLTVQEARLCAGRAPDVSTVNVVRGLIKAGLDPLGGTFEQLRLPQTRRKLGAVYTPQLIVQAMMGWAADKGLPARVVDPGAGSGRFIAAAARLWPHASLVACEIDPLASLIIRANAAALEFSSRLTVVVGDYREMELTPIKKKTLFIGNPPYVRHHDIESKWKQWFTSSARELDFPASKLAGLHAHFFLRTRQLARRGDYGCFVTSSEWLDIGYGATIREMLGNGLGGASLHVLDAASMPFGSTMTTAVITCFEVGTHRTGMGVQEVSSTADLKRLSPTRSVSWDDLLAAKRWSIFVRERKEQPVGSIRIGDLFRVKRGLVTGCNKVWIEGLYPGQMPARFLVPTVTKARDIIAAGSKLRDSSKLRNVLFLPKSLAELSAHDRELIERFLRWAKEQGADQTFTARNRSPWFHIGDRAPPAVLATYMGRGTPRFTRNLVGAQYLNIALGLYPHKGMSAAELDAVTQYLQTNVSLSSGRTYAGGLVKFEPGELEDVPIPTLEEIRDLTDAMDPRGDSGRSCPSAIDLSIRTN